MAVIDPAERMQTGEALRSSLTGRIAAAGYPLTVGARRADLDREADHVGTCVVDDAGVAHICEELPPDVTTLRESADFFLAAALQEQ